MTMFGLKEGVVAPLVRAVAGDDIATETVAECFARATWTGIAEPGDRVAGALVASLGAPAALTAVVERWTVDKLVGELVASGARPLGESELTESDLTAAIERWQPRLRSAPALIALKQAARYAVRLAIPSHPLWPEGLNDLGAHAPLALWVRGTDAAMSSLRQSIALVGARAATAYGEHVAMEASAGLVDRGFAIVSGAAYGIDGMAHRAALASSGQTIAFLAGGVDRFYPSGHDALLSRITEFGAVISELPCGSQPTKWRFLQRNRLIAAASSATVVLEAGWRSGSLNTAGHAAAIGRALGAVPGPVTSATSAGCHRLIREFGAICVTNAEEMAELASFPSSSASDCPSTVGASAAAAARTVTPGATAATGKDIAKGATTGVERPADQLRVLDALSQRTSRRTDNVAARSGLAVSQVQTVLGLLQLEGVVRERETGWVKSR